MPQPQGSDCVKEGIDRQTIRDYAAFSRVFNIKPRDQTQNQYKTDHWESFSSCLAQQKKHISIITGLLTLST